MSVVTSLDAVELRSGYDVGLLRRDLAVAADLTWGVKTWYSSEDGPGEPASDGWKCLAVRSPGGDPSRTDPGGPGTVDFAYTPVFEHLPYVRQVVSGIPGRHRAVEFLALAPGARSPVHTDFPSGFAHGWVRLHVPIVTNPRCTITINDVPYHWPAGTLWYGDVSQPHHVANDSDTTRVHLVIDVEVSPEMMTIFPEGVVSALGDDRVLHNKPEVPLPSSNGFACLFRVPAGDHLFTTDPWTSSPADDCLVTVTHDGHGRLRAEADDGVAATLVHTGGGTFRYLGWTDTHALTIDSTPGRPPSITWRYVEGRHVVAETVIPGQRPCVP